MNRSKVSLLSRLMPFVAALVIGCDGGATISSPIEARQAAPQTTSTTAAATGTEQQNTPEQNPSQPVTPAPVTPVPAVTAPEATTPEPATAATAPEAIVAPVQNDPVEAVTVSTEPPPAAEQQPSQPQQPAATAAANPTPADITDLILVTGQSNALGADTSYDPSQDGPDNRTFAYTQNGWQVADLHQIWDQGWFPRGDPNTDPSNNLSLHFGKQVTASDSRRVVGFVLVTAPGQPISHWQPNGEFFNSIRSKVSRAISELPSKSRIDGLLWHQGESDGEDDPAYATALYELISAFRSESWYGYNRPFICGETATLPVNRQLNRLNSDNDPHTACIAAEGLSTRGDDAHFTAAALRTIGRRYADQYLKMTR